MSRRIRVSTLVLGLILAGPAVAEGQSAVAAELPTYEVMGFPITPHQVSLMGLPMFKSAHLRPCSCQAACRPLPIRSRC
jgi:hypothetical protein